MGLDRATVLGRIADRLDRVSGYFLAFATVCTATGIRYGMDKELKDHNRLILFVPAVLVSAWYGGVGPGIFALLFSCFMCAWILIPPIDNLNLGDQAEQFGMLLYLLIGVGVIALVHREREAKRSRERAQEELRHLNESLEERVQERTRELEQANRELEGFCYSVSHDLRTPSRAITGNIHILFEDYGDQLEPPVREKLSRISAAAVKLGELLDGLLTYSRLAKDSLNRDSVELSTFISAEVRKLSAEIGQPILLSLPEEIIVIGDRKQLNMALGELIVNAVTYRSHDRPLKIQVDLTRTESELTVTFADNGIGFDPKYEGKIFQPFERLHRDEEYPGIGMGLAKVVRIAERHGGGVSVIAQEGVGCTFSLAIGRQGPMSDAPKRF